MTVPTTHDFPSLFREHAPFVWRVLRRHGVAERDLADLCQEVFIVVLRKLSDFRAEAELRTWIYAIAVRVAAGHRRLARVQRECPTDDLPQQTDSKTPEAALETRRALDMLEEALSHVKPDQREAFVLFELEEMTVSEVARALGCPHGTAFSRIQAGRDAIEAHLKRCAARAKPIRTESAVVGVSE